jgi:hypothetical protein
MGFGANDHLPDAEILAGRWLAFHEAKIIHKIRNIDRLPRQICGPIRDLAIGRESDNQPDIKEGRYSAESAYAGLAILGVLHAGYGILAGPQFFGEFSLAESFSLAQNAQLKGDDLGYSRRDKGVTVALLCQFGP